MKLKFSFTFLFLLTIKIFSQGIDMEIVDKLISEVKTNLIPDKRTAIFNVEYDKQSKTLKGETNLIHVKNILLQIRNTKFAKLIKLFFPVLVKHRMQ